MKQILLDRSDAIVQPTISTAPPDKIDPKSPDNQLNIFLFHVERNPSRSNQDLPTRTQSGEFVERPQVALDLHYLFTAYGKGNDQLAAHTILGWAMRVLNEHPLLTSDDITTAIDALKDQGSTDAGLLDLSNLADQVDRIKITLQKLSSEELSKLWSSLFQANYRISVVYKAEAVLIESEVETRRVLPVRESHLDVVQLRRPFIERVEPQIVEGGPTAELTVFGSNLKSDLVRILVNGVELGDPVKDINDRRIIIGFPDSVGAGMKNIQVIHQLMVGAGDEPFTLFASNMAPFTLAPSIIVPAEAVHAGDEVTVKVTPKVSNRQKVYLIIGDLMHPQHDKLGSQPVDEFKLRIPSDLTVGIYPVKLNVDGAESLLKRDPSGAMGPAITVS